MCLWCRPAAAAPIQPLGWKLPYAADVALKKKKKETKKKSFCFVSVKFEMLYGDVEQMA